MDRPVKKFIYTLILFAAALFAIDLGIGSVLDGLFFNLPEAENECGKVRSRFMSEKDIVLMGSSRCRHHFVSSQLLDSISIYKTGWTIYNYGLDGFFLNSSLCAVESMLARYTPKVIVIEADSKSILNDEFYSKGLRSYAPFYSKDPIVKNYLDSIDRMSSVIYLSHLSRYSGAYPLKIMRTLRISEDKKMGYLPLEGSKITQSLLDNVDKDYHNMIEESQFTVNNFHRVSQICKDNGVLLIIVSTPFYCSNDNTDLIKDLCKREEVLYYDYYNVEIFNSHPEWFYDLDHLNETGATLFTSMFYMDIKDKLLNIE